MCAESISYDLADAEPIELNGSISIPFIQRPSFVEAMLLEMIKIPHHDIVSSFLSFHQWSLSATRGEKKYGLYVMPEDDNSGT